MNKYIKPRLKPFVEYCIDNQKIYFFGRPGSAIELEDCNGFIAAVCKEMDGCKTLDNLIIFFEANYPNDIADIDELLSLLDEEGLLEDLAISIPENLSNYEIERWSRNIEFLGAYCKSGTNKYHMQEKIKNAKITILGIGGVGSAVLYNLAALGVQNIRIVDFDRVELSNLNRQIIYTENDIGRLKVQVAKERIIDFYPQANVEAIARKVESVESIIEMIIDQDIVINAADQPREQIIEWLNIASIKTKVPFLCGALDRRHAIYYMVQPGVTGCIECWKSNARNSSPIFQDFYYHQGFHQASFPNTIVMPLISILSGLMAAEILKFVTRISSPLTLGRLYCYDLFNGQSSIAETWLKNNDCTRCGANNSIEKDLG